MVELVIVVSCRANVKHAVLRMPGLQTDFSHKEGEMI
jgi:hypothetical protein